MTTIQSFRYALAIFAVVNAAAHLFPSPSGSAAGQFWFYIEVVVYAVLALSFILGLRRWYLFAVGFSALNLALFIAAGFIAIPGVTHAPLTANIDFAHYDISRFFSLLSYLVLIIFGAFLWLRDKGSKLERMY